MMKFDEVAAEAAAIAASGKATTAGAATGFLGWLLSVNWMGWAGILIALASLAVNGYFLRRRDKREAAESAMRIVALRARCEL